MSNSSASANATSTFPIFGLAFVILLVLKVAGMAGASWGLANLSWFWVVSPLLIGFGITVVVIAILFIIAFLSTK